MTRVTSFLLCSLLKNSFENFFVALLLKLRVSLWYVSYLASKRKSLKWQLQLVCSVSNEYVCNLCTKRLFVLYRSTRKPISLITLSKRLSDSYFIFQLLANLFLMKRCCLLLNDIVYQRISEELYTGVIWRDIQVNKHPSN